LQRGLLRLLCLLLWIGTGLWVLDTLADSRDAGGLRKIEPLESTSLAFSERYLDLYGERSGLFQSPAALDALLSGFVRAAETVDGR